jgi:hypothetical protein
MSTSTYTSIENSNEFTQLEKNAIISLREKFIWSINNLRYFNGVYWQQCLTRIELELELEKQNCGHLILKNEHKFSHILHSLKRDDVKFDSYPNLFCFKNKLFDINQKKFIDPKPEYYITQTTGYHYCVPNEEETKNIRNYIDSLFPIQFDKQIFMTTIATCLYGKSCDKAIVLCGDGGNGKTTLVHFLLTMLGTKYAMNNYLSESYGGSSFFSETRLGIMKDIDLSSETKLHNFQSTVKCLLDEEWGKKVKQTLVIEGNFNNQQIMKLDKDLRMKIIPINFRKKFSPEESNNFTPEYHNLVKNCKSALFHELVDYHLSE